MCTGFVRKHVPLKGSLLHKSPVKIHVKIQTGALFGPCFLVPPERSFITYVRVRVFEGEGGAIQGGWCRFKCVEGVG